jgi:hypothetical protein
VPATVDRIDRAAAKRPLEVGHYRVDEHVLPFVLFNGLDDDRDEAGAALAAAVRGARIHAVYPRYDDNCVNDAVNAYLRTGVLPATDPVCVKNSA